MTSSPVPLYAATDPGTLFTTAQLYAKRLGCECFPLVGKEPALGYKWRENALGKPGVHSATHKHWEVATGYAITYLPASKKAVIEIDLLPFKDTLKGEIPRIEQAMTVLHGGRPHYYVELQSALPKAYLSLKGPDGKEIASLRGAGAYVVGPRSLHPDGGVYEPAGGNRPPLELDLLETEKLLALFGEHLVIKDTKQRKNPDGDSPIKDDNQGMWDRLGESISEISYVSKSLVAHIMQALFSCGYTARWDAQRSLWWLNGQCPNHAAHKHGDEHASFGYNSRGVGFCFVCGPMLSITLADLLGIDRPGIPRPAPRRERRSDLIEAGLTLSVRLVDMLHALGKRMDKRGKIRPAGRQRFSCRQLLDAGQRVGWSRTCTYRNLRQAVQAKLLVKVRRGVYECVEVFETPAPARPFGPAYSKHPVEYRRWWLMAIERQAQPERPTGYCLSAPTIAQRAGITERSLYRHEDRLGIQRIQVWKRSILPTTPGRDGQPVPYLPDIDGKGYQRLEIVNQAGTIRRVDFRQGHALDHAVQVAAQWGGVVLLSERRPSIRVLPNQRARDRVPDNGTLSWDEQRLVIDPPQLGLLLSAGSPKPPQRKEGKKERLPAHAQREGAGGQRSFFNDTDLSAKSKTNPVYRHGQTVDSLSKRIWVDPKVRYSQRQQLLI